MSAESILNRDDFRQCQAFHGHLCLVHHHSAGRSPSIQGADPPFRGLWAVWGANHGHQADGIERRKALPGLLRRMMKYAPVHSISWR